MVSFIISFSSFSFQVIPLLVIMGTATTGATAFLIRQATKNPEAWYATLIFFIRNWSIEHFPAKVSSDAWRDVWIATALFFNHNCFFFLFDSWDKKNNPHPWLNIKPDEQVKVNKQNSCSLFLFQWKRREKVLS